MNWTTDNLDNHRDTYVRAEGGEHFALYRVRGGWCVGASPKVSADEAVQILRQLRAVPTGRRFIELTEADRDAGERFDMRHIR